MNLLKKLLIEPGSKVKLTKFDPADTLGTAKEQAEEEHVRHLTRLTALHELLYAERKRSVLIVLQGMDASGKDGTIKHVMSGVNPQGCTVVPFKQPSPKELDHDFLWRIHAAVPGKGDIAIFNRSQYEDVLIVRVHELAPKKVWQGRYEQINSFEEMLTENGTHVLKFFLHISKEEQEKRFQDRLADPAKNWKASIADFNERKYWDDYQAAYEDVLSKCSTASAPWHIIPANHKWFRNYAISEILIRTMEGFEMEFPKPDPEVLAKAHGGKRPSKGKPA